MEREKKERKTGVKTQQKMQFPSVFSFVDVSEENICHNNLCLASKNCLASQNLVQQTSLTCLFYDQSFGLCHKHIKRSV